MNNQKCGKAIAEGKIQQVRILLFGKEQWGNMKKVYIIMSDMRDQMFIPSSHKRGEWASN